MTKSLKIKITTLLIISGMCFPFISNAQYFKGSRFWKQYRKELTFGIGASQVLTDLGGRDQIGSDFIYDMELNKTRYALTAGFRYYLKQRLSLRTGLAFAMIGGDDALTKETFRNNRNLNFKSPVLEAATMIEYHLTQENAGSRYKLKGARGKKSIGIGSYVFLGVGGFWFDPRHNDGTRLRPLHTEGQGLPGGPKQYSSINLAVPVGFGLKYSVGPQTSVGLRFGWRFTSTDYLDDVSGTYYDKDELIAAYGEESYKYANPAITESWFMNPDAQRGDPTDRDNYGFLQATIHYKMAKKKRYGGRRKIKTRRSMPSF